MQAFSNKNRAALISRLTAETFDLLVIGGGITGAGIALDAASRGLKVALLEKGDFASGTSSKSTKLIHGGLRYLKQFDFWLVKEIGTERGILHKLAPHLVVPEKMLLPILKDGNFGTWMTSFGLKVYDLLASVEGDDKRVMLDPEEALEQEPLLPSDRLEGAGLYAEYRTDDARLTIEVIKTAFRHGALALNYCEVTNINYRGTYEEDEENRIEKESEQVYRVQAHEPESGTVNDIRQGMAPNKSFEIRARAVVNATGPWVDQVRQKNASREQPLSRLQPTKGVHLVFPYEKLPLKQAIYFDVPDGRMVFGIPRGKTTYVGTTDTLYQDTPEAVSTEMVDALYLIEAVNLMFPDIRLELEDVISSWAGLRPLVFERGKSPSELSRKDEIIESENGMLSIAGGKLTGYRKMAERIVDKVAEQLENKFELKAGEVITDSIPLNPDPFADHKAVGNFEKEVWSQLQSYGFDRSRSKGLVHHFGPQAQWILEQFTKETEAAVSEAAASEAANSGADPEVRLSLAELRYAMNYEMILTARDFFERRSAKLYFDPQNIAKLLPYVIEAMSGYFQWDAAREEKEKAAVEEALLKSCRFN